MSEFNPPDRLSKVESRFGALFRQAADATRRVTSWKYEASSLVKHGVSVSASPFFNVLE